MDRDKKRKLLAIRNSERKKGNYNSYAEIFDKKNNEVEKDFPKDPDNITKNELHEHFDLDRDGTVTLDEYAEHINYHCKNPDVLEDEMQQADFERGFKYAEGGIIIPFENIVHIKRPRRSRKISGDLESGEKLPKIVYYLKDKTKFDDFNDDDIYSAEFVEEIKGKGVRVMRDTDFAKGGLVSKKLSKKETDIILNSLFFFLASSQDDYDRVTVGGIKVKYDLLEKLIDKIEYRGLSFNAKKFAKGGKVYEITNIQYDTDDDSDLPKTLKIEVPSGYEGYEADEYISDKISDKTGFTHLGYSTTPEIEYAKGGKTKEAKTWKEKYNKKYGHDLDEGHSLAEIAKETGVSKKGVQQIYNKGVGAWKNNLGSVRLKGSFKKNKNTKKFPRSKRLGKEQWAKARVYSAVMGGKAAKVDAKELKMMQGGELFAPSTYMYGKKVDLIHIYNEDESRNWQDNAQYMIDHYNKMGIKSGVVHKGKLHGFYVEQGMFEKGGEMMTGIRTPEIVEFEDGGDVDLFEHYQKLPPKARDIVDRYMEKYEEGDYNYSDSKKFLEEMENVGYTFEYGLDNEPYDLRKMAKGGALSKEFKFDKNFVIYVPSTSDVGKKISEKELDARVDEVEKYVANLFGGYTETETDGGYKATTGEIIEEDIVKVSVFANNKDWKKNEKKVVSKVKDWAKRWGQEAIGFEYEGDLYYIDDEGKFKKGGLTPAKAKKMLKDGTAQGKPLTDKQKRYFGAIAGGKVDKVRERARMERGGKLKMDKSKERKDYQLDYLYHQLELSKEKMENSKSDKEINTNTVRYNTIKKMIDNKLT